MWGNLDRTDDGSGGFLDESRAKAEADKPRRAQNLFPAMIGHLLKSSGELEIWGMSAKMICVVGILKHIEQATTKVTYEIEDETGSITVFKWLEADKVSTDQPLELNSYVKVFGFLREQNEKKHLLAQRIFPLADLNELTNHLLEVTYVILKAQRLATQGPGADAGMAGADSAMTDDSVSGLTKDQAVVFKAIQAENDTDNGIHRDDLKARVPKNILAQVDSIIDFLTSEGHIYTTLTDDHFKTT